MTFRKRTRTIDLEAEQDGKAQETALARRHRKIELPIQREHVFLNALRLGLTIKRACYLIGVDNVTLYRWKAENPEFNDRIQQARAEAVVSLADKALQLAESAESEAVRLNAVKWLLGSMAEEFQEQKNLNYRDKTGDEPTEEPDYAYL